MTKRPGKMGGLLALAALAVGSVAAPGAGGSAAAATLDELKDRGFVRIAIANEPPYTEVKTDGSVSGAAVEVARAVFERLGVPELVASVSEYGAMIPGLQAGRFDVVTAGLFMKPQRCQAVAYSEPDVCDAEAFAVQKGNPLGLVSFKAVAEHASATIGAPGGGTEERLALEAGVPRNRVIVVPDGQSGIKMLRDGRIDAYALPTLSIADLLDKADDPNLEMVAPVEDSPIYCAGAAFRKQDTELRDAYDKALAELKSSGEFTKIVEPFGFPAKAAMVTSREQLCTAAVD